MLSPNEMTPKQLESLREIVRGWEGTDDIRDETIDELLKELYVVWVEDTK